MGWLGIAVVQVLRSTFLTFVKQKRLDFLIFFPLHYNTKVLITYNILNVPHTVVTILTLIYTSYSFGVIPHS